MQYIIHTILYIFEELQIFLTPAIRHPLISLIIFASLLGYLYTWKIIRFPPPEDHGVGYDRTKVLAAAAGVSGSAFATCLATMLVDIALTALEKMFHMGATISSAQL